MTRKRKMKMKMKTRSQSKRRRYDSSEESTSKMCLPLGYFSILPTEIIDEILSSLPIRSIISLASTCREWSKYLNYWLSTSRASNSMVAKVQRIMNDTSVGDRLKKLTSWFRNFGKLVREITKFNRKGEAIRMRWLQVFMTKLVNKSCQDILRGFPGFLRSCFKSSDSQELAKVVELVVKKTRLIIYINNQLRSRAGYERSREVKSRHVARALFRDRRLFEASMRYFIETKTYGRQRRMSPKEIARLIFVFYGPVTKKGGKVHIGWTAVSESYFSSSVKTLNSINILSKVLNMPFWRKEPFCIDAILQALLGGKLVQWSTRAIKFLFQDLDKDLIVAFLKKLLSDGQWINCAHIMARLEKLGEVADKLRNEIGEEACQELASKLEAAFSKKHKGPELCGDCKQCGPRLIWTRFWPHEKIILRKGKVPRRKSRLNPKTRNA